MRGNQQFLILSLALMSIGYLWLWTFNRNPHVLIKFVTMESYFCTWLYFLLRVMKKNDIFGYSITKFYEFNLVYAVVVTLGYFLFIHSFMLQHLNLPGILYIYKYRFRSSMECLCSYRTIGSIDTLRF